MRNCGCGSGADTGHAPLVNVMLTGDKLPNGTGIGPVELTAAILAVVVSITEQVSPLGVVSEIVKLD